MQTRGLMDGHGRLYDVRESTTPTDLNFVYQSIRQHIREGKTLVLLIPEYDKGQVRFRFSHAGASEAAHVCT